MAVLIKMIVFPYNCRVPFRAHPYSVPERNTKIGFLRVELPEDWLKRKTF